LHLSAGPELFRWRNPVNGINKQTGAAGCPGPFMHYML
jgi:hypothetical protein